MSSTASGYSGTPLARKLGIKEGHILAAVDAPATYEQLVSPLPAGVTLRKKAAANTDVVHLFATDRAKLTRALEAMRDSLALSASAPHATALQH